MNENVREMLAREAVEAEAVADAVDRGEIAEMPGQRGRQSASRSQVYSLRLPAAAIAQLRAVAVEADEPPTALLRRFVLERLALEARRQEHTDVLASAVDDLLPLLRQRLLEAAHVVPATAAYQLSPSASEPEVGGTVVNVGPSRRKQVSA